MLPSKKDILDCKSPFLLEHPAGDWSLVINVSRTDSRLILTILYIKNNQFTQRNIVVSEPPFYVGADVWELEYGSILMTLDHPTLSEHPAKNMWDKWNEAIKNLDQLASTRV